MTERTPTGIDGLDDLIDGGLLNNTVTVLSGGPGTGKTMLATQFVQNGLENDETCLYISTEEMPAEILHDAEQFGWDLTDDEDTFHIKYINPSTRSEYFRRDVEEAVKDRQPDRIVIDSISVLGQYWEEGKDVRTNLTSLVHSLKEWNATTLVTAESPENSDQASSRYGIVEFVADGVIELDAKAMGSGLQRTITVKKMRSTAMDGGIHDLEFTANGLVVGE
jgi:KaiC/GvpD/RAD55 family RecA-like ATPase